jgi:hypothetical protein
MSKQRKPRPHTPSAAELANDGSLRWCPYRRGELLTCDTVAGGLCRFQAYTAAGLVELASYEGIVPLGVAVDPLLVRRPTAAYTPEQLRESGQEPGPGTCRRTWRGC